MCLAVPSNELLDELPGIPNGGEQKYSRNQRNNTVEEKYRTRLW